MTLHVLRLRVLFSRFEAREVMLAVIIVLVSMLFTFQPNQKYPYYYIYQYDKYFHSNKQPSDTITGVCHKCCLCSDVPFSQAMFKGALLLAQQEQIRKCTLKCNVKIMCILPGQRSNRIENKQNSLISDIDRL